MTPIFRNILFGISPKQKLKCTQQAQNYSYIVSSSICNFQRHNAMASLGHGNLMPIVQDSPFATKAQNAIGTRGHTLDKGCDL
ncbi:Uncharacterized protein HZ326_20154 [Fusarium oxysporum f. sp. albedinis]|nr:Uncharacterized protein HZ326_20154 [Fusarium oxysporum f. sp. albedinis]